MSGEEDESNTCVVCFKNAEFYSVGQCDHPVCYECSTRMRVLCQQTECPICRQEMPKVIFADEVRPFCSFKEQSWENKYKIGFVSAAVEKAFRRLLQHCCKICRGRPEFKSFAELKDHMRKEHELYYCDLCVDNLKIFGFERRCYKRAELGQHRRRGDSDDRSHRGHPLCEFCDERFMDNDELFRHLRRIHLYCHFCDADGYHRYFGSYDYLREHFRTEHYLCEEGDCKEEKLTSVFRSDIDLKAHRASVHARSLGKAGAKQARTLELEFTLAPRPRGGAASQRRPYVLDDTEGAVGFSSNHVPLLSPSEALCPDNFPSLGSEHDTVPGKLGNRSRTVQYHGNTKFNMTEENFPALHGGTPNQTLNISLQRGTSQRPTTNNLSIQVKHRSRRAEPTSVPTRNFSDFPSLGTPSSSTAGASSWKGTVAPRSNEVVKLQEKFSTSCNTSASKSGSSKVSVKPNSTTLAPKPVPTVETEENKPGGSKAKKKKNKGRQNSTSPLPITQANAQSSTPSTSFQTAAQSTSKSHSTAVTNATTNAVALASGAKPKGGEARKCSELKIGELREGHNTTPRAPPAPSLMSPPPGFPPKNSIGPPPGFSVTLNSVARPANGLTFTNSSGQSFSIRQSTEIFQPPPNFEQRNASLVQNINEALQLRNKESGALSKFRQLSADFLQGVIEASVYYEQCRKSVGDDVFAELFPELLALLPNIRKQQELWRAHGRQGELQECRTCGQVVRSSDARAHFNCHVRDSHFPALGDQSSSVPSWPLPRK